MLRQIQKISLLLSGYSALGVGLLTLGAVLKALYDVIPEVVYMLGFGAFFTTLGFWTLGKYEKIFGGTKK